MRIALVANAYPPHFVGGAEIAAHRQAVELVRRGHALSAFCAWSNDSEPAYDVTLHVVDGVAVTRVNVPGYRFEAQRNFANGVVDALFARFLERERPDAVHFHNLPGLSLGLLDVAEAAGIPAVVTFHDHGGFCLRNALVRIADGQLESANGIPSFRPDAGAPPLRPGDRVTLLSRYREQADTGVFTGAMDNAGGVAALALAAPVLAEAGIEAMLAFPDEEEGPVAPGNHMIGRGSSRLVSMLPAPQLAIVADVQQAGGDPDADTRGSVENSARLGEGAILAEFSSVARGAVTPPDLYALAHHTARRLGSLGVSVQESNNAYSSRSDDVSVMLKTPNILLLGFPGFNRHHDQGEPRAHLDDVVNLAKALVYMGAVGPVMAERRRTLLGD